MARYLTEFVGTFFLVLTIGMTVAAQTAFAPLAIGSALMVMVYMGGHVSGAHYNPAVTVAVFLRGRLAASALAPYMVAQVVGAFAAAAVSRAITGDTLVIPPAEIQVVPALLVEILFTLALALVVLNTATARETKGNSYFGLAIGFTVMVGAYAGGGVSGGAFNPAVGLGPTLLDALVGGDSIRHIWIYIVGPIVGGLGAAALFRMQNPGEVD